MMIFRKSVSLEIEPLVFMACHGNSVNNTKAIQTKTFLNETLRFICIHCQNFISIEVAIQELGGGGGFTQPPSGQSVGQKHLRRARVYLFKGVVDLSDVIGKGLAVADSSLTKFSFIKGFLSQTVLKIPVIRTFKNAATLWKFYSHR